VMRMVCTHHDVQEEGSGRVPARPRPLRQTLNQKIIGKQLIFLWFACPPQKMYSDLYSIVRRLSTPGLSG